MIKIIIAVYKLETVKTKIKKLQKCTFNPKSTSLIPGKTTL